jgi:hypothetical protein
MGAPAGMREPRRMKPQALIAAAALLTPATAVAAPTVKPDLPCYYPGQPIALSGAGYTPAGGVGLTFQLAGARGNNIVAPEDPLKADAAGGIAWAVPAPDLASDSDLRETVTLTAKDQAANAATTQFLLTAVGVRVAPWFSGRANPRALATFKVIGWEPFRKVYAHYFLDGKRLRTVEIGSVTGPCGDLTKKLRQFPFRPVPAGHYSIRFTGTRVFDSQGFYADYRDVVVSKAKAVH